MAGQPLHADAARLADKIARDHHVFFGANDCVMLQRSGVFLSVDEAAKEARGNLNPCNPQRAAFVAHLRGKTDVQQLEEVGIRRFSRHEVVRCGGGYNARWQHVLGEETQYLCSHNEAARISLVDHRSKSVPIAVNSTRCAQWRWVVGTFSSQADFVWRSGPLQVLLRCSIGAEKIFSVLVATEDSGLTVQMYHVKRSFSGAVTTVQAREVDCGYLLACGYNGDAHCFTCP